MTTTDYIYLALAVIFGLPLLIIPFMLRRVVEPNEVHIVQRHDGTRSFGRGQEAGNSYYEWPSWIPIVGVQTIKLPLSNFSISLHGYAAYDKGRLQFELDIIAFFRIDDPGQAAARIHSIEELKQQLTAVVQGAVRSILAKEDIEQIMGERSVFGNRFTEEVKEHLPEWGVVAVKSIELMDIRDANNEQTISNIMAKKASLIEKESRVEVAQNLQAAKEAEIAAQQAVDIKSQDAMEAVGKRTADQMKNVGVQNEKAKQDVAVEAKATADKNMDVKRVQDVRSAQIAKDVQVVAAEQQKETDVIKAEGAKRQTVLQAEGHKEQVVLKAEGDLVAAQRNAEGTQAVGTAEADVLRQKELAPIQAQIELAKEIGGNQGYQEYLINIRRVEMSEVVGVEQAKALTAADIRVITNAGSPSAGIQKIMDVFSSKGGTELGAMVEAFAQSPMGEKLLERAGVARPNGAQ